MYFFFFFNFLFWKLFSEKGTIYWKHKSHSHNTFLKFESNEIIFLIVESSRVCYYLFEMSKLKKLQREKKLQKLVKIKELVLVPDLLIIAKQVVNNWQHFSIL